MTIRGLLGVSIFLLAACTTDAGPPDVVLVGDPAPPQAEPSQTRTRNMNLEVIVAGQNYSIPDDDVPTILGDHCSDQVIPTGSTIHQGSTNYAHFCDNADSDCVRLLCEMQLSLCMAHRALAVAQTTVTEHLDIPDATIEAPPQDSESKALLARWAFFTSSFAAISGGVTLQSISGISGYGDGPAELLNALRAW